MRSCSWLFLFLLCGSLWPAFVARADERPAEAVTPAPRCEKHAAIWRSLAMPQHPLAGDIWINPVDGMEMVYIAAGPFRMGNEQVADERPYRKVTLDAYWIAKYTVTVAQFRKYVDVTHRVMPETPAVNWQERSPIVNVDWNDAAAYARWANGRLPSEAEWEKAARGFKNVYPWGNAWDATRCNHGMDGNNAPMIVGSFPAGASDFGVMDMAGNVAQWCADAYKKPGDVLDYRTIRGGSCHDITPEAYRCSHRDFLLPTTHSDVLGFRYVLAVRE